MHQGKRIDENALTKRNGVDGKSRRQRQRERRQTKGLMNRRISLDVCYEPLYVS